MKKLISVLIAFAVGGAIVSAADLTAPRDTPSRTGQKINVGVFTNTIIYAGSMVGMNASGYAIPATTAANCRVIGRAAKTVDNRVNASGAGTSGILKIDVEVGVFGWDSADTSISDASIGSLTYVWNDHAVTNGAGVNSIIAGVIRDYDAQYIWVDTFMGLDKTAGSMTTLAASGNATIGGTLQVTGAATLSAGIVGGTTKVCTNSGTGYTNYIGFSGGVCTNVVTVGTP